MNMKRKIFTLTLFSLIFILSVSMVSAGEMNKDINFDDTLKNHEDMDIISDENANNNLGVGNTIYISPDGSGSGSDEKNPTNWNNAISNANSGDTIQFLNGTYYNIKGTIYQNVELKGSGNSILDANNTGGFITIGNKYSKGLTVSLTDLSFINAYTGEKEGNPDGPKTGYDGEGAIVNGGTLIVKNCYFASNQGIGTEGGAIHNAGTCYIYDSTFFRNGGKKGGAIYSDEGSSLYIYNSTVNKCVSKEGSAVHAKEAYVEIHNCTVVNASAKNGLFYVKKSQIYFYDSYFYNSKAVDAAAVINIDKDSTVEIDRCIFDHLSSTGSKLWFHQENGTGNGGAIVVEKQGNTVVIKNSIFTNCTAKGEGGAIYMQSSSKVIIDNCTFKSNKAGEGGNHIYTYGSSLQFSISNSVIEIESAINTADINVGETENVIVSCDVGTNNLLDPTINVLLNGKSVSTVKNQETISLNDLNAGEYEVLLTASDSNSNTYVFTQQSSSFTVSGENHTNPVENHTNGTFPIENQTNGTVPVENDTNSSVHVENNTNSSDSAQNQTAKISSEIIINAMDNNGNIFGVLKDSQGKPICDAEIRYVADGVENTVTTSGEGLFKINVLDKSKVDIMFDGNNTIDSNNLSVSLNNDIVPKNVKIASRFNFTSVLFIKGYAVDVKAGEEGMTYVTQLVDANGKPIANAHIQFALNSKIYDRITSKNGSFTPYHLNMIKAARYTLAFSYLGDDSYNGTLGLVCVDLYKKPITIKASSKSFKASAKTKKYTISLSTIVGSSADGKAHLSPKTVTLKVNGKTYTAKTKNNGKATFKLKLTKKAKYNAEIIFKGDNTYDEATKNVKITVK